MKNNKSQQNSKIGGQAVIEGVMMRGENSICLCVRDQNGNIRSSAKRPQPSEFSKKMKKIPVIRGIWAFGSSLSGGIPTLMDSAEVFGEEEPSKFEKWLAKTLKIDLMSVIMGVAVVLGVGLAVGLFFLLPSIVSKWFSDAFVMSPAGRSAIEGGVRLLIFVAYILLTSLVSDVKRVYMYHGAEHKTINCFERGLDMTVENAKSCSTFHNRCGTSFMFFVILLSIVVSSLFTIEDNELLRIATRIAFLPLLAGLAYELIVFLAKHDWWILYPLRLPGILMQKITTSEPTEDMLEVAIASFSECQRFDADASLPSYDNLTFKYYSDLKIKYLPRLQKIQAEDCELDWMICHLLKCGRADLSKDTKVKKQLCEKLDKMISQREKRIPLDYILGESEFFGLKFQVDSSVLIPRPETELLVENAIAIASGKRILDIGTGSGAIAVSIRKNAECSVVACDISETALEVAKKNAEKNGVEIEFLLSDVFQNIEGVFDIIISNPPYIAQSERKTLSKEVLCEPETALFAEENGLAIYRKIIENALKFLSPNGILMFEIGYTQGEALLKILEENGYHGEVFQDYSGLDRIVIGEINV